MTYKFACPECKKTFDIDIPMAEYDSLRDTQLCPVCLALDSNHVLLKRVIEWNGIASGNGEGWFGRSDGSTAI